jgi:phosphoribosylaminoimidazolecarboxamide formyltransferase/IMP cyclohydrolase
MQRSLLNGVIMQETDKGNYTEWKEAGGRPATEAEKEDLQFANLVCKHLKSNAIALVKHKQLIGKGCGQTSRIDSLRQAIEKANQFQFDLRGAVMASDAFSLSAIVYRWDMKQALLHLYSPAAPSEIMIQLSFAKRKIWLL